MHIWPIQNWTFYLLTQPLLCSFASVTIVDSLSSLASPLSLFFCCLSPVVKTWVSCNNLNIWGSIKLSPVAGWPLTPESKMLLCFKNCWEALLYRPAAWTVCLFWMVLLIFFLRVPPWLLPLLPCSLCLKCRMDEKESPAYWKLQKKAEEVFLLWWFLIIYSCTQLHPWSFWFLTAFIVLGEDFSGSLI